MFYIPNTSFFRKNKTLSELLFILIPNPSSCIQLIFSLNHTCMCTFYSNRNVITQTHGLLVFVSFQCLMFRCIWSRTHSKECYSNRSRRTDLPLLQLRDSWLHMAGRPLWTQLVLLQTTSSFIELLLMTLVCI